MFGFELELGVTSPWLSVHVLQLGSDGLCEGVVLVRDEAVGYSGHECVPLACQLLE